MRGKTFDHDDWTNLERALQGRQGAEPDTSLEDRVLESVRQSLAEPGRPPALQWRPAANWAALAAVLIVGLALSQMAASVTPFFQRPAPAAPAATVQAAADLMRQVSPGLTADEADRLALASASRRELPAIPIAKSQIKVPDTFNSNQGDVR